MSQPQETIPGCPPGLEYLTQIDQLLVNQQIEIFEGMVDFSSWRKFVVLSVVTHCFTGYVFQVLAMSAQPLQQLPEF